MVAPVGQHFAVATPRYGVLIAVAQVEQANYFEAHPSHLLQYVAWNKPRGPSNDELHERLLFEQAVDAIDIVERIVDMERQRGHNA